MNKSAYDIGVIDGMLNVEFAYNSDAPPWRTEAQADEYIMGYFHGMEMN